MNKLSQKSKVMIITCIICLLMNSIAVAVQPMYALPIKKVKQLKTWWCWAASSVAILDYYGTTVSQSDIVTLVKGSPVDLPANGYEIQEGLENWGISSGTTTSLPFSTITSEIYDYRRPIIAGIYPGHAVVVDGYDLEIGYIEYMDPQYPSYEFVLYDNFIDDFWYAVYQITD